MLFSRKNFGVIANDEVNNKIGREYENNVLLQEYKIGEAQMDSLRSVAKKLKAVPYIGKGDKFEKGNSAVAYGLGYGAGFLIYITLFIYGAMVMRGVMEEKVNRIAEVVISSVKPFELMMGKIIGVGAVGLTQFLLWIILLFTFSAIDRCLYSSRFATTGTKCQQSNTRWTTTGQPGNDKHCESK